MLPAPPPPRTLPATENRSGRAPFVVPGFLHCPEQGGAGRLLPCHVGFWFPHFLHFEQQAEEAGGSGLCCDSGDRKCRAHTASHREVASPKPLARGGVGAGLTHPPPGQVAAAQLGSVLSESPPAPKANGAGGGIPMQASGRPVVRASQGRGAG